MTISDAILKADELRPNAITAETKAGWVNELNAQVSEYMDTNMPPVLPVNSATQLLMPYPYDNIYVHYLCAMIDSAQEEFSLFNNDMAVYNNAIHEALNWWRRHHKKESINAIRGVWA